MSKRRPVVLLVDDDEDMLRLLGIRISSEGFEVRTASNGDDALGSILQKLPDVMVTDLKMPGMDGMRLLETVQRKYPTLPIIMITAHGTIPDAIQATKHGAAGFITKPIDKEELLEQLNAATKLSSPHTPMPLEATIVTRHLGMQEVLAKAGRAAGAAVPVLVIGESGTGKELIAKHIHESSGRGGPFIPVNCSAIPDTLLESELFGHVKGAFTGADRDRQGLMRAADGGTLFMDEVGDMAPGVQAKLLRALQEKKIRPVGAHTETDVDVLVVSATHRNLATMIESGDFREDLYYRLNVVQLDLPPLRERPEDIPLLVQHFLLQLTSDIRDQKIFSPEALEILAQQSWPGNIRQLNNVVQQCVAMATGNVISAAQVRDALGEQQLHHASFNDARDEFTRHYLVQLLKFTEGNVSQAARLADRNRTDFHKLLKKHNVDSGEFKS